MLDRTVEPVPMPTLEEFDASGPVVQFLTSVLGVLVEQVQHLQHRLDCIENGSCEWIGPTGPEADEGNGG